jgi:hypothetical protein
MPRRCPGQSLVQLDRLSGIDHYVLQRSVDGGAWSVLTKSVPTTSKTVGAAGTHSYRYRVVAVDKAGNTKTGAAGGAVTVSARGDTSSSIAYTGRWTTAKSTAYTGGVTHYAAASGAKATFKFTGRGFSWIASNCPTRGSARVYVNGVDVKTVSLYAATTAHQRLAFTKTWSTAGTRTITIQVVGTSGHPRVDLDAIYSWQ